MIRESLPETVALTKTLPGMKAAGETYSRQGVSKHTDLEEERAVARRRPERRPVQLKSDEGEMKGVCSLTIARSGHGKSKINL